MPHGLLRNLLLRYRLDNLIVDQQAVDVFDFQTGGIRWLELNDPSFLAVFHSFGDRLSYQFLFVFELFHEPEYP